MSTITYQYRAWPANTIIDDDRHIVDPARVWVPSPGPELIPLPPDAPRSASDVHIVFPRPNAHLRRANSESRKPNGKASVAKKKLSKLTYHYWKNKWFTKANKENVDNDSSPTYTERLRVGPAAFRAYGYWARPTILGVTVDNAYKDPDAGPSNLGNAEVERIIQDLRDPDGTTHPDKWISRVEHPCLPPRPSLWPTPPPSPRPADPPPPQIQLNPLLQHRVLGKSAMKFDLRSSDQADVLVGDLPPVDTDYTAHTPGSVQLMTRGPNGAQPATYPGVKEMKITALADETTSYFPWPYTVQARDGLPVTVQDVVFSTLINFAQFMTREEVSALEIPRRAYILTAYRRRLHDKWLDPTDEGIRRVEYLGDRVIFRGLEPAPNDDGWIMFVGPVN